jgi:hypothetical protein
MSARFAFDIDRARGLVRITMGGFYTPADVRAFLEARREAHEALGWPANAHVTLNDIREMAPQPQTMVDAFAEMLADPEYRSRRLAFVVSPTLARSQVMRALASRAGRCFADPATAEAWLLEADVEPLRKAG